MKEDVEMNNNIQYWMDLVKSQIAQTPESFQLGFPGIKKYIDISGELVNHLTIPQFHINQLPIPKRSIITPAENDYIYTNFEDEMYPPQTIRIVNLLPVYYPEELIFCMHDKSKSMIERLNWLALLFAVSTNIYISYACDRFLDMAISLCTNLDGNPHSEMISYEEIFPKFPGINWIGDYINSCDRPDIVRDIRLEDLRKEG